MQATEEAREPDGPEVQRAVGARPAEGGIALLVIYTGAKIEVFLTDDQAMGLIESIRESIGDKSEPSGVVN